MCIACPGFEKLVIILTESQILYTKIAHSTLIIIVKKDKEDRFPLNQTGFTTHFFFVDVSRQRHMGYTTKRRQKDASDNNHYTLRHSFPASIFSIKSKDIQ